MSGGVVFLRASYHQLSHAATWLNCFCSHNRTTQQKPFNLGKTYYECTSFIQKKIRRKRISPSNVVILIWQCVLGCALSISLFTCLGCDISQTWERFTKIHIFLELDIIFEFCLLSWDQDSVRLVFEDKFRFLARFCHLAWFNSRRRRYVYFSHEDKKSKNCEQTKVWAHLLFLF